MNLTRREIVMKPRLKQYVLFAISIFSVQASYATLSSPTVSNDATNINFSYKETTAFPYNQVFIDSDTNTGTGYPIGGIGADLLVENGQIYKYVGPGWNWSVIQNVTYTVTSGTYSWVVPLSSLSVPLVCNQPLNLIMRATTATAGESSAIINYKLIIGSNCGGGGGGGTIPVGVRWNYVLSEAPDLSIKAGAYDIDGFDNSASTVTSIHSNGAKAICYIDAGTWENWRPDANQFPNSVKGNNNGWPGEKWLDIRQISILGPIMQNRLDMCKSKGFDAVEFDNVDGYTNSTGFPLTAANQITYNTYLAQQAQARGLKAALKNDVDQISNLVNTFDFAINEECWHYNECSGYAQFISKNKAVLNVEYTGQTSTFCPKANSMKMSSIKKSLDLTNPVTFCN